MDKRALFFLGAAVLCAVLTPATPGEHRWFAAGLAVLYAVLAVASWLDNRSRNRDVPAPDQPNRPVM
jgi:Sec-independent protein secretion pathway component TatC